MPVSPRLAGNSTKHMRLDRKVALVFVALLSACSLYAQEQPITNLYAGTLIVGTQDGDGAFHRDTDMFSLRMIARLNLKYGLMVAARGDLTALSVLDVNHLDFSTVRSAEGYASVARPFGSGLTLGPAVIVGGLVPVSNDATWRFQSTWMGGGRIGYNRSWLYVGVGRDGASDSIYIEGGHPSDPRSPLLRMITSWQLEFGRFAFVGDFVSGQSGRARCGVLFRVPVP